MKSDPLPFRSAAVPGFCAATLTTLLTLVTFVVAVLTPPLSGPYCAEGCYTYPYAGIAARFPRDYYWMYPAMLVFGAYAVLLAAVHRFAAPEKKLFSLAGLFFGWFAAAVLIADFFVQVSVVPPSLAKGETDGIALLTQFNPHGLFIVLEELGYLLMSVSFLFLGAVFDGNRLRRAVRYTFLAAAVLNLAAFAFYAAAYGIHREYRFEVAAITINWLALIVSGILLGRVFRSTDSGQV
jgi:hypothetical protein